MHAVKMKISVICVMWNCCSIRKIILINELDIFHMCDKQNTDECHFKGTILLHTKKNPIQNIIYSSSFIVVKTFYFVMSLLLENEW